jgi:hypothetical protein
MVDELAEDPRSRASSSVTGRGCHPPDPPGALVRRRYEANRDQLVTVECADRVRVRRLVRGELRHRLVRAQDSPAELTRLRERDFAEVESPHSADGR